MNVFEKSPVRVLEKALGGGLGRGNFGVVLSRTGVGKTGFLIGLAMDQLLQGRKVAVLDRNMGSGHSGIFAAEIRSALSLGADPTPVFGYVLGLGGRDIRVDTVLEIADDVMSRDEPERCLFVGVKGLPIGPARPDVPIRPLHPLEEAPS